MRSSPLRMSGARDQERGVVPLRRRISAVTAMARASAHETWSQGRVAIALTQRTAPVALER